MTTWVDNKPYVIESKKDVMYVLEKFLGYDAARDLEQFLTDDDIQEQLDNLSSEYDKLSEEYDDLCNDLDDARCSGDSLEDELKDLRDSISFLSSTPLSKSSRDELFKMLGVFLDKDYTKDTIINEFESKFRHEVEEIL